RAAGGVVDRPERAGETELRVRDQGRAETRAQQIGAVDGGQRERNDPQAGLVAGARDVIDGERGGGRLVVADTEADRPGAAAVRELAIDLQACHQTLLRGEHLLERTLRLTAIGQLAVD